LGRRGYNLLAAALLRLGMLVTLGVLVFVSGYILYRGIPGLSLELLTREESILRGQAGILPCILNTVYVIVVSLAVSLPLGVGAAVYLTEYAPKRRLAAAIEFAAETLSGIPSILYAMVGVIVFCNVLGMQKSLLAGSLTLAIMTLPTVIRATQESLKTVITRRTVATANAASKSARSFA